MKEFQAAFLAAIHSGHFDEMFDAFIPAGELDGMGIFRTYHMDYSTRLSHALKSSYPAVAAHLQSDFSVLCQAYILAHPSHHPDLGQLGQGLADFLKDHPLATRYPFLPDMARLEASIEHFFHADTPVATALDLVMAPEDFLVLVFDFVPHQIIASAHGLYARWQQGMEAEATVQAMDETVSATEDAGVLVGKTPTGVQVLKLNAARLLLMQALSTGVSLGEALDTLLKQLGNGEDQVAQAMADIQALFLSLRQHGFLAALKKPV